MKKIYYCIVEALGVFDDMTDDQIDALLAEKANGKDYIWSENENLLDTDCCK